METFKPYLSIEKTSENYLLTAVLSVPAKHTIEKIVQQEIDISGTKYWGVVITVSEKTSLMNGPELPILSTQAAIDLNKAETYQTIKCVVEPIGSGDGYGPSQFKDTDIDFADGGGQ